MAVKKTAAGKRRKRRITAKSVVTARKKIKKPRKKRATAKRATKTGRKPKPKTKAGAKKTTTKRRPKRIKRRKTRAKVGKGKTATRGRKPGRKAAVKKKPSKSKTSKKTSPSRVKANRKPRAIKNTISKSSEATEAIRATSRKKQRQVKSDSQALPIKQQPSLETKMAESKKPKKRVEKQVSLPETRLESVTEIDLNIAPYKERPGEDYMSADQQSHFRRLLLQRKRMLLEDMGRTVHHLQDEGTALPDMSDRATQEEEFNLELRARDRERKLIKKIEHALQQLDEGHYGYCDSCGVEIGIRRLEARPTAALCIDCKTLDEIREKQMGG